jgi:hypothetical protein
MASDPGGNMVFALDVPNPPEYQSVAMTQTSQDHPADKLDRTVGVCQLVQNPADSGMQAGETSAENDIGPVGDLLNYFRSSESKSIQFGGEVKILQAPKYGQLQPLEKGSYTYIPNAGYFGTDKATFLVNISGMKVKMVYTIHVEDAVDDSNRSELCPRSYRRIADGPPAVGGIPTMAYLAPTYSIANLTVSLNIGAKMVRRLERLRGTQSPSCKQSESEQS